MKKLSGAVLVNAIAAVSAFAVTGSTGTGQGRGKAFHDMTPVELREIFQPAVYKKTDKGVRVGIKIKHELVTLKGVVEVGEAKHPIDLGKSIFVKDGMDLDAAIDELKKVVSTGAFDAEYQAAAQRLKEHAERNRKPSRSEQPASE